VGSHAAANRKLPLALLLHCAPPQLTLLSVSLTSHRSILDATTATKVPTVLVLITHFINATSFTSVIFAPADELVS
jgi:hypothetical protein